MNFLGSLLSGLGLLLSASLSVRAQAADTLNLDADYLVRATAVQPDGKFLLGGGFSSLGGQNRGHIPRLDADGSLDTGFHPFANGDTSALAVQVDAKILVAGYFTTLGGQKRNRIARLNADVSLDTGFERKWSAHRRTSGRLYASHLDPLGLEIMADHDDAIIGKEP